MLDDLSEDDHVSPWFQAGNAVKRFSQFLGTKPQHPNHVPPIGPSQFSAVPIDVIEEILLHLPSQDILRMKQVCWGGGGMPTN